VIKRVAIGVYSDGFIHAGNLAYLTLVALFPFFIVAAAITQIARQATQVGVETVNGFLLTVPRGVADVLRPAITDVLSARTGNLLWIGALVRPVDRRQPDRDDPRHLAPRLWHEAVQALLALSAERHRHHLPERARRHVRAGAAGDARRGRGGASSGSFPSRTMRHRDDHREAGSCPPLLFFAMLYAICSYALTPGSISRTALPEMARRGVHGALVVHAPPFCCRSSSPISALYSLTYGGLAGAMITLIFFFIIGLGVVIGAELNAALAEFPVAETAVEETEEEPS
jgi:membrane protein